jgi:hypothetical protein
VTSSFPADESGDFPFDELRDISSTGSGPLASSRPFKWLLDFMASLELRFAREAIELSAALRRHFDGILDHRPRSSNQAAPCVTMLSVRHAAE